MTEEKRRERRHRVAVPALIVRGKRRTEAQVRDVSFRGMFLETDDAPGNRQLIRIELQLPTGGNIFSSHATVVRVSDETADGPAGVGIELFANDREKTDAWDEFVRHAEQTGDVSVAESRGPLSEIKERRRTPRFAANLEMRLRTNRSIHTAYSHDMSQGGILVLGTDLTRIEVGEAVVLNVIHPESNASFRLPGTVRRRNDMADNHQQLAIEFDAMDSVRSDALLDFILTAVEIIEERKKQSGAG